MKLEDIDEFKPIGTTIMVRPILLILIFILSRFHLLSSIPRWNMFLMMLMVMK
jgi:hypothetical protein